MCNFRWEFKSQVYPLPPVSLSLSPSFPPSLTPPIYFSLCVWASLKLCDAHLFVLNVCKQTVKANETRRIVKVRMTCLRVQSHCCTTAVRTVRRFRFRMRGKKQSAGTRRAKVCRGDANANYMRITHVTYGLPDGLFAQHKHAILHLICYVSTRNFSAFPSWLGGD